MADQSSFNQTLQLNIQNLRKKQRELELISKVVDFVSRLPEEETEFKEVADKVRDLYTQFSSKTISLIEAGALPKRLSSSATNSESATTVQPVPSVQKETPAPQQDKVKFLVAWRHLDGARVKVGDSIGTVRGCDAPNLIVVLENGTKIEVSPEKVETLQSAKGKI